MNPSDTYFEVRDVQNLIETGLKEKPQRKIGGAFLYESTTTLLFSRTNYGKSLLAFNLAYVAATGTSIANCEALKNECEPMKVLVIDLELQPRDLALRHGAVLKTMPREHYSNLLYLHEKIDKNIEVGISLLKRIEKVAIAHQAKLVIIDNLIRLLSDALNGPLANQIISTLRRIQMKTGASMLVISHTTKGNPKVAIQPTDYYGSSMIQNFFTELSYLDASKDGRFFLCHQKTKFPENYSQSVPVFTRGEHPVVGVGFNYEAMMPLVDIQLPYALKSGKSSRRYNLSKFKNELDILIQAGIKPATIAKICDVDRSAISRLFKK